MFDRFTRASSETTAAGLLRIVQNGPVRLLLLALVLLGALSHGRGAVELLNPFTLGGGPQLASLVQADELASVAECRSDACTVATVSPVLPPPLPVPVSWLPEPVLRRPWPPALSYRQSQLVLHPGSWIAAAHEPYPGSPTVDWALDLALLPGRRDFVATALSGPAYLARLVYPDGAAKAPMTLEAHTAEVQRRLAAPERDAAVGVPEVEPEGFEIQPMTMPLRVQLAAAMVGRVRAGDPVTLRFDAPRGFSPPVDAAGEIVAVDGDIARVMFRERGDRWLRHDYLSQAPGRAPATDRVTLLVRESLGGSAGEALQVPVSALVRPGAASVAPADEAIVWVVARGMAAPVRVRVGSVEGDQVLVNELRSPHRGAIDEAHWRSLPIAQRAHLHRLQAPRLGQDRNLLLHKDARIVREPSAALRAGDPLRSH
jgi:hypothetical protein